MEKLSMDDGTTGRKPEPAAAAGETAGLDDRSAGASNCSRRISDTLTDLQLEN